MQTFSWERMSTQQNPIKTTHRVHLNVPSSYPRLLSLKGVSLGFTEFQQRNSSLASRLSLSKLAYKVRESPCHFHNPCHFILSIFIPSPIALFHPASLFLLLPASPQHGPLPLVCLYFTCIPLLSSFPSLLPPLMLFPPRPPYTNTPT